ncbi:pyochelin biosynthetic protein PchC [Saccharopolyspora antimicrobica]|uniref:Pyochelin biosynthetic protein PchC n=1 Tax=Saccharopolyspora antimicrobica TaxID=455193 RepID=A0A1I5C6N6_9PSEU|nr:alpha/beta fold hydrolase [Saccharopolyspora antimicrobica]RKT88963.1 pyochelin biosynthetic protein PchC [Saccharopolyspora antimicrobica]SFN82281.1 pyochelin biosynthetic protein PchC [Saccharopolyspora antimicrobica]
MTADPSTSRSRAGAFRRPVPRPYARARVLLFPHGGGSASYYRSWAESAPWDVEFLAVQYPGREDRYSEPLPADMQELAAVLAADLPLGGPPLPTVLFGHSMGAIVAYEIARQLEAAGEPAAGLVVSGHPAPALSRPGRVHLGSDEELVQELRRTGATNLEILDNASFMAAFLPVIRSDYRLSETYRELAGPRLRNPVTVLYGDQDTEVDSREAEAWREVTDGTCELRVFAGGHFYLDEHRDPVVEILKAQARAASRESAVGWPSTP